MFEGLMNLFGPGATATPPPGMMPPPGGGPAVPMNLPGMPGQPMPAVAPPPNAIGIAGATPGLDGMPIPGSGGIVTQPQPSTWDHFKSAFNPQTPAGQYMWATFAKALAPPDNHFATGLAGAAQSQAQTNQFDANTKPGYGGQPGSQPGLIGPPPQYGQPAPAPAHAAMQPPPMSGGPMSFTEGGYSAAAPMPPERLIGMTPELIVAAQKARMANIMFPWELQQQQGLAGQAIYKSNQERTKDMLDSAAYEFDLNDRMAKAGLAIEKIGTERLTQSEKMAKVRETIQRTANDTGLTEAQIATQLSAQVQNYAQAGKADADANQVTQLTGPKVETEAQKAAALRSLAGQRDASADLYGAKTYTEEELLAYKQAVLDEQAQTQDSMQNKNAADAALSGVRGADIQARGAATIKNTDAKTSQTIATTKEIAPTAQSRRDLMESNAGRADAAAGLYGAKTVTENQLRDDKEKNLQARTDGVRAKIAKQMITQGNAVGATTVMAKMSISQLDKLIKDNDLKDDPASRTAKRLAEQVRTLALKNASEAMQKANQINAIGAVGEVPYENGYEPGKAPPPVGVVPMEANVPQVKRPAPPAEPVPAGTTETGLPLFRMPDGSLVVGEP